MVPRQLASLRCASAGGQRSARLRWRHQQLDESLSLEVKNRELRQRWSWLQRGRRGQLLPPLLHRLSHPQRACTTPTAQRFVRLVSPRSTAASLATPASSTATMTASPANDGSRARPEDCSLCSAVNSLFTAANWYPQSAARHGPAPCPRASRARLPRRPSGGQHGWRPNER